MPPRPRRLTFTVGSDHPIMHWCIDDFSELFQCSPDVSQTRDYGAVYTFCFATDRLRYMMVISPDIDHVAVSADPDTAFGGIALVEAYAACDHVERIQSTLYPDLFGLYFWYGSRDIEAHKTLSVMQRPDGDLIIWATPTMPDGHFHEPTKPVEPTGTSTAHD